MKAPETELNYKKTEWGNAMKNLQNFIYALLSVFIVAFTASYFTRQGISSWYHAAVPSRFSPPDSAFRIIWTALYLLMAASFYGILRLPDKKQTLDARLLFLSQLLLNIVWCFSFFYAKQLAVGFCIILVMDYLVYKTIVAFKKLKPLSARLLYPYFLWLCYATFLNLIFVINNGLIVSF